MILKAMMVVSDPGIAAYVAGQGLDRLFVDLEVMGKAARQPGDTWKSALTAADITPIREACPDTQLMVRVNPLHEGSATEIDEAIARGADVLMLPMFRDADTVARFAGLVKGRVPIMPLVETAAALEAVPEIAGAGPEELYFGLNDLHLDLGRTFMFEPLAEGMIDAAAEVLRRAGIPFGIGGIARAGEGAVPAELVLGEHVRLGSEWVILSRGFHNRAETLADLEAFDFRGELQKLRAIYADFEADPERVAQNQSAFRRATSALVAELQARRG